MKNSIRWTLALAAAWTLAQWQSTLHAQSFGQPVNQSTVLTLHADGHCEVESRTVFSRAAVEQQVQMVERMKAMEESGDDDDMPEMPFPTQITGGHADEEGGGDGALPQMPAAQPKANTNALTDDQLKEKYMETMVGRFSEMESEADKPNVIVDKDNVTVLLKSSFASIREMLQGRSGFLSEGGIYLENARFETDTNGHLLVTLTPNARMKRGLKNERTEWKVAGLVTELKFVFPGKVLSSGLPETQTNATWLAVDSKKDETLDAMLKLYDGPIVITAEAAGLTLKEPLEAKTLLLQAARRRNGGIGEDLPLTDAGPGFVAQAEGLTTTTLHLFPAGASLVEDGAMPSGGPPGTTVQAKLFPPKGRTLQSVTDVKLLAATDDKGRAVAAGANGEQEQISTAFVTADTGGPGQNNSAQVQLHLQLPQPDAEAIDEISVEAVAVTAGSWKELTLSNITEKATNEFDIGAVLPGAKLIITKFSNKNNSLSLQARITGPATVKNLKVEAKAPGTEERSFSNSSDINVKTTGGETTRNIRVNASIFDENGRKAPASFQLLVRSPQDLKRERVNFKLKGLDLL